MSRLPPAVLIFLILLLVPAATAGERRPPIQSGQAQTFHISRQTAKIDVDGKLNEPVWETLAPITTFTQQEPDLGAPVTERTEVRIFYDDDNLYVGFRCYDSAPGKIVHRLGPHDSQGKSDTVSIFLDPFHDRRTGYYFGLSAAGIQFDALSNEGNLSDDDPFFAMHDSTWDGIWHSAASLESWGWSAEIVIPFKTLRIPRVSPQVWGLNLRRSIPRKNEIAHWAALTRFDVSMRPSKAGTLTGLEKLHVGRNLELIPFFSAKHRRVPWAQQLDGASLAGGFDARYGLAANLTANVAVLPDFGETESDEFTSQISRYEIFFPEKRKFFTEGANHFTTPMQLFFSRRIGARQPDGEPQDILEGAKITGQAGSWTLGALEAVTQRSGYVDPVDGQHGIAPRSFFGVVRLQRNILQKSAFGFISVNRIQGPDALYDANGDLISANETAQAVDLNILHGEHMSWASQFMVNTSSIYPGMDLQHLGWTSQFRYDSDRFGFSTGGKFLGRHTELSQIGYEPETDRWSGHMNFDYKPFLNRWGIRQLFLGLNYDEANGTLGELEDSGADAYMEVQFKNFWTLAARASFDRVRFNQFGFCDSTASCDARPVPQLASTRVYEVPRLRAHLHTNENRSISFGLRFLTGKLVQYDENIYGSQKQIAASLNARIGNHLLWELNGTQVRESLWNHRHYQNRNFLISRWQYQFTPRLRARLLAQYASDHRTTDISINSLVAYDFTARSAFYVGYNRQRRSPLDPSDLGDTVFVKMSYLFSF